MSKPAPRGKPAKAAKPVVKTRAELKAHVKDRADFASFLADDGAFLSAARVLREIADECESHQLAVNRELEKAIGRPIA